MNKLFTKKFLVISVVALIVMAAGNAVKYASGPPPSKTDAPGETSCTDAGCHGGTINPTPANLVNLKLVVPFSNGGYVPDSTYTLTLTYNQSGISWYGFQITALAKSDNSPAGTFTSGTGSQKITGIVSGKTREYLTHTSPFSGANASWTFTWKAPTNNVDSIVFYAVINAANGDANNSGDQIYGKKFTIGPSSLLPEATAKADKTNICVGDTVSFTGSGTNSPTSFAWKFRGTPTTSSLQNPKVVYNIAGTFTDTLRVTNSKGVSAPSVVTIKVNSKPTANIVSISPNDTVCQGDTVTITAAFFLGTHFRWNTLVVGDTLNTLRVAQSGSYYVTITNNSGCANETVPVKIVVLPKPVVALTASAANDTVCGGDSVTFTATAGMDSYDFKKAASTVQNSAANTYKTPVSATATYSVTGTLNGCTSAPAQKTIVARQRLAAPVLTCGTSTTSSVTFNWGAVAGAAEYEVSADIGKTWAAPSSGAAGLTHTVNGLGFNTTIHLLVRAKDQAPCNTGLVGMGNCTSLGCAGIIFITTVSDTLICPGDSVLISINNISASQYAVRMVGGNYSKDTLFWVKPVATTQYQFEILDSAKLNCGAEQVNIEVKMDVLPPLSLTLDPLAVCQGKPVKINASPGYQFYAVWINNDPTFLSNDSGKFVYFGFQDKDSVKVDAFSLANCKVTSANKVITIYSLPNVGFTASVNNHEVTFADTTGNSAKRVWRFGDNSANDTAKNPVHTYAAEKTYNVTLIVTNANQCVDSVTVPITTLNVSVGEISGLSGLQVYPNPTTGKVQVSFALEQNIPVEIKVADIMGKTVWSATPETTGGKISYDINLQHLPDGVYMLRLTTINGEKTIKLLKQAH